MAKEHRRTNPSMEKEQAEGDRETVEQALEHEASEGAERERGARTGAIPRPDIPGHEQQGVTNHPLSEEEREQRELPPRGEAKKPTPGGHA